MGAEAQATSGTSLEREWWRNAALVLREPKAVFRAMRDEETEDGEAARQEPIVALILLAGLATVLSFSSTARELMDAADIDGALVPVLAFLAGGLYGFAGYWLGGFALLMGIRGAKGESTYREARHVLGYSLPPLALSLLVWPLRLALFGADNFRSGGSDEGVGYWGFTAVALAFLAWSLFLLTLGVREVHEWTTLRALGAIALAVLAFAGLALLALLAGGV